MQNLHLNCSFPSWTVAMCIFKLYLFFFQSQHNIYCIWIVSFLHEWFQCDVHGMFWCEFIITNITFVLFLSFMNDCNMSIHGVVWCKFYITNITFELLVLFMKCCNGYNQILLFSPKLALHISHLNGLFSSWKVLMCPFMSCLDVKSVLQMSHLKAFFPSWTVAACFFKLCFDLKFILQISHLHCCFPTYIVLKYVFSNYFCI